MDNALALLVGFMAAYLLGVVHASYYTSERKYNEAYDKGYEDGRRQAPKGLAAEQDEPII